MQKTKDSINLFGEKKNYQMELYYSVFKFKEKSMIN